MERDDVLRLPVFKDGEGVFVEVGDNVLFVVDYGGVQQHFVHVFAKDEDALIVELLVLDWTYLYGRVLIVVPGLGSAEGCSFRRRSRELER